MKHSSLFAVLIAFSLIACGQKPAEIPATQTPAAPSASPSLGLMSKDAAKMAQAAPEPMLTQKAQVLSAINVAPYTYLEVTQDNKTRWLATTATTAATAKKGDTIQFDDGTLMTNFNSKVLNRTFPSIALVGRVIVANGTDSK
jgi:predicted small lipoprotein YifL